MSKGIKRKPKLIGQADEIFWLKDQIYCIVYRGKKLVVGWYIQNKYTGSIHKVTKLSTNLFAASGIRGARGFEGLQHFEIMKNLDQQPLE